MGLQSTYTAANSAWKSYDQWIEQNADRASYTSASPENALVLIGPNRKPDNATSLLPIGLLQNFTIGQNINWQAQQMIGSARTFFLAGKAPGNGTMSRLFTSSSTLLGAIYTYAQSLATGGAATTNAKYESKAFDKKSKIMFTLDTELLKVPVGMACFFRNTMKEFIGGFYVENMVIPNINMGFAVGQPAIFETVNVMFDRVVPYDSAPFTTSDTTQLSEFDSMISATVTPTTSST